MENCLVCQAPIEEGEKVTPIHCRGEVVGNSCSGCKNEGGI